MKIHSTWKKILVVLLVLAFVAIFAGGWIYYSFGDKYTIGICLAMTLQNCMESLLFNPILTIQDIVSDQEFWQQVSNCQKMILEFYDIAMIVAPLIDVLFIFSILDGILHIFVGVYLGKKRVLIVGYNDDVKCLIKTGTHESKIYLWTENSLSTEEERDLYFQKVVVKMNDFSLGDSPEEYENQIVKFNRFLKKKKITNVILLDKSDTRNMQYYMALSSCEFCKTNTVHFYVHSSEFEYRNALQDYFDYKLDVDFKMDRNGKREVAEGINTHMDLRIFNFAQIQAEILFERMPLHVNRTESDKDIHLLILGGDVVGEELLLHAMNQGVISPDNEILIEVLDKDISGLESRLDHRFNLNYVTKSENVGYGCKCIEYTIDQDKADGILKIRLFETDIYENTFEKIIGTLQAEKEFTYAIVAIPDLDSNLYCAVHLDKALSPNKGIPVAFRMDYLEQMKDYFTHFDYCSEVYLMGDNEEYIGLDQIMNSQEEERIREYHLTYENISNSRIWGGDLTIPKDDEKDIMWNKQDYYRRQSNRALYYHRTVKEKFFKTGSDEMNAFWECSINGDETDEVWSGYLVEECDGKKRYPELLNIAITEHRRFNYYYASEGWGYSIEAKRPDKRVHDCLCTWDDLKKNKPNMLIYDLIATPVLMAQK
ncbi:MAG: hypothetical protein PUK75_07720 [bacterium]|nr:hypothetical protein [bacterium]MDY4101162.1 hypothetical protein [Lachnospiraceae bacterium]